MQNGGTEKGGGGEEVGELLRRQIPPLLDALMLIHSERPSCLSAYTASLICFFSLFPGVFPFSLSLPHCFLELFFLFSSVPLSYLMILFFFFLFLTNLPVFAHFCPLTSHQHLIMICHSDFPIFPLTVLFRIYISDIRLWKNRVAKAARVTHALQTVLCRHG